MDAGEMAEAIAIELDKGPWKAVGLDIGEIQFISGDGEKFLLTVVKVDSFGDENE